MFYNNYKWSIAFKNGESACRMPETHIILQILQFKKKKREETRIERDTCTPVFITALFIIARTWKQPRCPSADERIRKLWYIYTMEYYSAIKKSTFGVFLSGLLHSV